MGLQETRWTGSGKYTHDDLDFVYYYSGGETHERGVAFALRKDMQSAVKKWWPVNDRIMGIRLCGQQLHITIFVVYAPTNGTGPAARQQTTDFYKCLEAQLEDTCSKDVIVVLGDFNAEVGNDHRTWHDVLGKHGLTRHNENGSSLLNFCQENGLSIMGTHFPHKNQHKITWYSPDGVTSKMIDHVLIGNRFKSCILDVKVDQFSNIGCGSGLHQHRMVMCKLRCRIRKNEQSKMDAPAYDREKLKQHETAESLQSNIRDKYLNLTHESLATDINLEASTLSRCLFNSACDVAKAAPRAKNKHWISDDTLHLVEKKHTCVALVRRMTPDVQTLFLQSILQGWANASSDRQHQTAGNYPFMSLNFCMLNVKLSRLTRLVKKTCRSDRNQWATNEAHELELHANSGNSREVFLRCRKMREKPGRTSNNVKAANGTILNETDLIASRFAEHFDSVLNVEPTAPALNLPQVPENDEDWNALTYAQRALVQEPTQTEIHQATRRLKNHRAPGASMNTAELLKAG